MLPELRHSERDHALLSASSAGRWLKCSPSARLEDRFRSEDKGSVYSREGTLAHEMAELKLLSRIKLFRKQKSTEEETRQRRARVDQIDIQLREMFGVNYVTKRREMDLHTNAYVNYVMEVFAAAVKRTRQAVILLEVKLDLREYIPEGFGTSDVVIIAERVADVIDFKYGMGVAVSAYENEQMKTYGIGTVDAYDFLYDFDTVRMHIMQPRMDAISCYEMKSADLIIWAKETLQPGAKKAFAGEGEQVVGNWCRFCKASARCVALKAETVRLAAEAFAGKETPDPGLIPEDELMEIYQASSRISKWLSEVTDYVYRRSVGGKRWEGYKLVKGRNGNRAITDPNAARRLLLAKGYEEHQFTENKLVSVTALEDLLGKKEFNELMAPVVVAPPGKPTLVPLADKRPAIDDPESYSALFDNNENED